MRHLSLAVILTATLATSAFAKDPAQTANQLIDQALEIDIGYKIIESLTTEVGPRPAGSKADAVAVAWAMEKLKSLNFDRVWKEPVKLEGWQRGIERAAIISPYSQPLRITTLGGSVATPEKGLEAQVAAFTNIDDLRAADADVVKGKIVFLSEAMTRTQDGSGYSATNQNRRLGAIEGARKGAVAVLIRSVGTDSHRFPHTGQMAAYKPDLTKIPAAAMSNPDADLLERILERSKPVKIALTLTPRSLGGVTTYNVIGEVRGRSLPDQKVLIAAHLDSWDLGTGAVDDGAGVGIVSAAGHLIGGLKQPPKRSVRVVFYGAEEVGLYGARTYMQAHAGDMKNHIVAAESDFGARKIWAIQSRVGTAAIDDFKAMAKVLRRLGINYRNNRAYGGPDVGMLASKGVPLATLAQNGTDYFDLHHTADDTFDKIEPLDIRQNVAAYAAFAYMMAEMDVDWSADKREDLTNR